ncbi:MAG: hypothetical protein H6834_11405 [Planctomycetes bacterium]|nr:hypothetical protein [Planctomycetota bacterium]
MNVLPFVLTMIVAHAKDPAVPEPGDLNPHVIKVLESYPRDGTHDYYWPKGGAWAGVTQDLQYAGKLFLKGDEEKRCYCSGITFEVFLRAYERWCQKQKQDFVIADLKSVEDLEKLRRLWFGTDGNRRTLVRALVDMKLGVEITSLEKAKPGDFVQLWRHSGSGHSVVFIDWERKGKEITGIKYWSSQKSTQGIGYRTESFGEENGVIREQTYVVRVGRETKSKR